MNERYIPHEAFGDEDPDKHARIEPIAFPNLPTGIREQMKKGKKFSNSTVRGITAGERSSRLGDEKNEIEDEILGRIDAERAGMPEEDAFEEGDEEVPGEEVFETDAEYEIPKLRGDFIQHQGKIYPMDNVGADDGGYADDLPPKAEVFEGAAQKEPMRASRRGMTAYSSDEAKGAARQKSSKQLAPSAFAKLKRARQRRQGKREA